MLNRSRVTPTWTKRRADGAIQTMAMGRITHEMVRAWGTDFQQLGGARVWIFDAMSATSYSPEAVAAAGELFARQKALGLKTIVAAIHSPLVRMGASVVKMGLRVSSGIELCLYESMETAEAEVRRRLMAIVSEPPRGS